jgi:hypothetical protein
MALRVAWIAIVAMVGAVLVIAPPALAGAPNYDCVAGEHGRVAIDQWGGVVAVSGVSGGSTQWADLKNVQQNGPSLDITFKLGGTSWHAAVRGGGTSFVLTRPELKLTGHCQMMLGTYVLRRADAGGSALRAAPSDGARFLLRIPLGTAVWEIPNPHAAWNAGANSYPAEASGSWYLVSTFIVHAGSHSTAGGWLRQRLPSPR